jgi:DNA-binding response OmpR family regulator
MAQTRILIVEDDAAVRRGVADAFGASGYTVLEAADGPRGLEKALGADPELVLLDVMLPELDGIEVLRRLRRERPGLPVILLTARGAEADRVRGLRTGADDYVVKPFSVIELIARVEAVLRRSAERPQRALDEVTLAGRVIDFERRQVAVAGRTIDLTERETDVLAYLVANPERVIDREELLRYVWKIDPKGLTTRTVDMLVARLREHLGDDPGAPEVIATVRGRGYRLAARIET